jgi:hypothetical protein
MNLIEAYERKIQEAIKDILDSHNDGYQVKSIKLAPLSDMIIVNIYQLNVKHINYSSIKERHIQKLLSTHKAYWMEKFNQESKTPRIYNFTPVIDDVFYCGDLAMQ